MILNFNYTETSRNYIGNTFANLKQCNEKLTSENLHCNFIHGQLDNPKNPILLGFGDEHDETYKEFEHKKNNDFFKHIKSFDYFKTTNYQNLLRFTEMDDYEVAVAGHSCGLSNRTLLKHIFEHEKCKRIKIFHYVREDRTTNYTDLTYDIARHILIKKNARKNCTV